ncbi:phage terminase small subunit [Gracilibacillus alcaliphilus]|uniref:phage terminase small subunit n=1 Tax=Gracilibacillus alcaliphilus TaxID=1401441 RepID=UPI00195AA0A3|nr:uncharacterized protein YjcR [Gracilibacillus alcaliphilus]
MARPRNPKRDEAFKIWKDSNGTKKLKDIAADLEVSDSQIRKWKNQDNWNSFLNGNVTKSKGNVTKRNRGAPKGSKNALGNKGGAAPKGNQNATTHGFFSKFLPADTIEIMDFMNDREPVDLIYDQIRIQYAAIIRAQSIMFVESKEEMIRELKKRKYEVKNTGDRQNKNYKKYPIEEEFEFQFAWDRHATFLNAQSRAMSEFRSLIKQFNELAYEDDERRLKLEQMQLAVDKAKADLEDGIDGEESSFEIVVKRKGDSS